MSLLKMKIFALLAVVLAVILGAGFFAYKSGLYEALAAFRPKPERVTIMSELAATKEINRLYTGFYLVPIMDVSYGDLKRDLLKYMITGSEEPRMVPRGYCLKKYDAGFGYDDILELLQDTDFMGQVCSGDPSALPAPRLLAINSKTTEINGDYRGSCLDWDLERNRQLRRAYIYRELNQGEALKKINERGRKLLHSMASLLCSR